MPTTRERILIAVTDVSLRSDLQNLFAAVDYDVAQAESSTEAFQLLRAGGFDLLLLSADSSDPIFSSTLTETNPSALAAKTRIILLSSASPADRARALDLGVDDVIAPPWDSTELLARARAQLRTKRELHAFSEKTRLAEESWEVAQTAFQALAVTEKMTRDAFNLERALKIGVGALFALALVVGGIFLLFSRRADKESRRAYSMIAQLERGVQSQQNLLSATQKAREEMLAAEGTQPRAQSSPSPAPSPAAKSAASTLESPEQVIHSYAPSVCLIHVSVGFVDKNSGQPLRYGGIGPDGPYKDSQGNTVYTLEVAAQKCARTSSARGSS